MPFAPNIACSNTPTLSRTAATVPSRRHSSTSHDHAGAECVLPSDACDRAPLSGLILGLILA